MKRNDKTRRKKDRNNTSYSNIIRKAYDTDITQ